MPWSPWGWGPLLATSAACKALEIRKEVEKIFLAPTYSFFFRGNPRGGGGGGGVQKNRKIFFRTPKPEISSTLTHLFGFGRCKEDIFKVTIDVSADMGGICVSGHKDPLSVPATVQRPPWPLISGQKCYITPAFSGVPNKGDNIKAQKSNKNQKKFLLCRTSYL